MKTLLVAIIALAFTSCATTQQLITPPNVRTATTIACTNALMFVKSDADRVETANYIFAVAHAVRTLSGGKVPTPDEMKNAINVFTPSQSRYAVLATNLSSIWGALYNRIISSQGGRSNSAVALEYLEAMAGGAEDGAAPYLPKP